MRNNTHFLKSAPPLILFAMLLCLAQTSCRRAQPMPPPEPVKVTEVETQATIAYWKSLIETDTKFVAIMKEWQTNIAKEQERATNAVAYLYTLSDSLGKNIKKYNNSVGDLPVKDVDQRLLDEVGQDMRQSVEIAQHLKGMAEAADTYQTWSQRVQNPSGAAVFNDLMDSFVMGMEGRPFAGYDKMKKDAAQLDSEGQQIAGTYMSHAQALNTLIQNGDNDKIKEMELRRYLAQKYNAEFPPRPNFDD